MVWALVMVPQSPILSSGQGLGVCILTRLVNTAINEVFRKPFGLPSASSGPVQSHGSLIPVCLVAEASVLPALFLGQTRGYRRLGQESEEESLGLFCPFHVASARTL